MKINGINLYTYNSYGKYTNKNVYRNSPLSVKSFGKSDTDNSFNAFTSWAEETDFYSKALNIIDYTGKILGSGFEGTTYEIPHNDKWVIKEEKRSNYLPVKTDKPQAFEIKDLTPDFNLGQMIAYVTIPSSPYSTRKFYVLKKQKGISYGVPYKDKQSIIKPNIDTHINSLKLLASLPQDSYNKVIDEVIRANKAGLKLDYYNPNNIMIDTENNKVNFVDVEVGDIFPQNNQLYDILYAMLDGEFAINFNKSSASKSVKAEAKKYSFEIISKFEKAANNSGEKLEKTPGYNVLYRSFSK